MSKHLIYCLDPGILPEMACVHLLQILMKNLVPLKPKFCPQDPAASCCSPSGCSWSARGSPYINSENCYK